MSFLNAKPLIDGLEDDAGVELGLEVPSRLLDGVRGGRFDVALLPVIDYQRLPGLRLIPAAGGIGCDGPTLTVRVFSPVPVEQIRTLACDADSHTSVALARILLAERYGARPEFIELNRAGGGDAARLLIGDKVVCEEPDRGRFPHQIDLGGAWKEWTGLPFVFAAWMARAGVDLGDLPQRLEQAKRRGLSPARVEEIIQRFAVPRGWPAVVAREYLTNHLRYDIAEAELRAIRLFHELAARHGLVDAPPRPLELYPAGTSSL